MTCKYKYNDKWFTENELIYLIGEKKNLLDISNKQALGRLSSLQEIFKQAPQLQEIGTIFDYDSYLDTIFPDSKVKDIVYRGAEKGIENHRAYSHWTLRKSLAENFVKQGVNLNKKEESNNTLYFALLDVRNLIRTIEIADKSLKDKGFDSAASFPNQQKADGTHYDNEEANESIQLIDKNLNNEITVFEPEQIHILGSKQDVEGFKNWVDNFQKVSSNSSQQVQQDFNTPTDVDSFAEEAFKCK